jgi:hypothetical protein
MDYRCNSIMMKILEDLSLRFMISRHVTADVFRQGRCVNGITGGYPAALPSQSCRHTSASGKPVTRDEGFSEARDEVLSVRFYGRRQLIEVDLPHALADRTARKFSMGEIA